MSDLFNDDRQAYVLRERQCPECKSWIGVGIGAHGPCSTGGRPLASWRQRFALAYPIPGDATKWGRARITRAVAVSLALRGCASSRARDARPRDRSAATDIDTLDALRVAHVEPWGA